MALWWRRRLRAVAIARPLAVLFALVVAACATAPAVGPDHYDSRAAARVFGDAYDNIFEKYIERLEPAEVALRGIEGLDVLDPLLHIDHDGSYVQIAYNAVPITRLAEPGPDDIDGWAHLTTSAIDAARGISGPVASATAEDLYRTVLGAALEPLDRHSRYAGLRSARDYRAQREGFGGIGIRLNFDHGLPEIISVLPDSPAGHGKLKAGDVITEVDGAPLDGLGRHDIIWRLRGDVGTNVRLGISRRGTAPLSVVLRRSLIVSPTVHLRRDGDVAIISISGFNQRTSRNLNQHLSDLFRGGKTPPAGIVLDLRGNPGGLLDQAVAVADSFMSKGRIVSTRGRHPDSFQLFNATGKDRTSGVPMAVLINGQSASAAEIVASALQDAGRAVVVGSNSYGKGSIQNIARLPNDGELILTWSRFHAPSGYALENLGVMPNICTSGEGPAAAGVGAASLTQHISVSATLLTKWRAHSGYDAESARDLRKRCPRRSEQPEEDVTIARRVLADQRIYARALGASGVTLARTKVEATGTN